MTSPFSLYLHIPFCAHKCPYCDFNTYAVSYLPEEEYVLALLAELDHYARLPEWERRTVQTIYFGGGTPSLFAPQSIDKIISAICKLFPVQEDVEITLEANPGTVDHENLAGFLNAGVNRLSIGSQSFQKRSLEQLGRKHSPEQIEDALNGAREAGFHNINLDLIYGTPKQTLKDLKQDLIELIRLDPGHISAYGLTIEKGTPFYRRYASGRLSLPQEGVIIDMMKELSEMLHQYGYTRYEISNYARPGREAKHNMAYWNGDDYLGLGAGAHSFVAAAEQAKRWSNYALPNKYIKEALSHGKASSWFDTLSQSDRIFEFFFLGLRKIAGVSGRDFKERFSKTMESCYPAMIEVLTDQELLVYEEDNLRLTQKGLLLADSVIENFSEPTLHDNVIPFPTTDKQSEKQQPLPMNS